MRIQDEEEFVRISQDVQVRDGTGWQRLVLLFLQLWKLAEPNISDMSLRDSNYRGAFAV